MIKVIAVYNQIALPPYGAPQPLQTLTILDDVEANAGAVFYSLLPGCPGGLANNTGRGVKQGAGKCCETPILRAERLELAGWTAIDTIQSLAAARGRSQPRVTVLTPQSTPLCIIGCRNGVSSEVESVIMLQYLHFGGLDSQAGEKQNSCVQKGESHV